MVSTTSSWQKYRLFHTVESTLMVLQMAQTEARNFSFSASSYQPGRGQMDRHCQGGERQPSTAPGIF